jgi:hypothetical protein
MSASKPTDIPGAIRSAEENIFIGRFASAAIEVKAIFNTWLRALSSAKVRLADFG